jgi:hypothetical protein
MRILIFASHQILLEWSYGGGCGERVCNWHGRDEEYMQNVGHKTKT